MSAIIITNDNNVCNVTTNINCNDITCDDLIVRQTITCETLDVNDNINCQTLNSDNVNITGDIYVAPNQSYMPTGSICIYSGQTAPTGWLICDGTAISRTLYSRLYSVINTLYGSGDGVLTFNLPNLQERIPVGKTSITNLGNVGGNNSVTLSVENLPSHSHTGTTESGGIHNHTGTTTTDGLHTHNSNATGGQGNFGLCLANGLNTAVSTDNSSGELNLWRTPDALSIYSSGSHSHTLNINNDGDHTHTFTTNTTGSGNSIDIRNKFIIMNYIIRY